MIFVKSKLEFYLSNCVFEKVFFIVKKQKSFLWSQKKLPENKFLTRVFLKNFFKFEYYF